MGQIGTGTASMATVEIIKCCQFIMKHTHTHTHPFNGPYSGTTQVSRYQKGKTNLDFSEAKDSEWQWHQLGHMHICTLLQTDNHASTPPLVFYRPDALTAAQPTASKHWRHTMKLMMKQLVLSSDQLRAVSLIGRNAVTWLCALLTVRRSSWHVIEYL